MGIEPRRAVKPSFAPLSEVPLSRPAKSGLYAFAKGTGIAIVRAAFQKYQNSAKD
jgi:hypothetical protein